MCGGSAPSMKDIVSYIFRKFSINIIILTIIHKQNMIMIFINLEVTSKQ